MFYSFKFFVIVVFNCLGYFLCTNAFKLLAFISSNERFFILHTLTQLNTGELAGIKHLSLSENLTEFPEAILTLADSLEILDLSHNQLSRLPDEISQLHKLKPTFRTKEA